MSATSTATTAVVSNVGTIINSSNIQSLSFTTTFSGIGSTTVFYKKIGKLYFNISFNNASVAGRITGGGSVAIVQATLDSIATFLGLTINTYYLETNNNIFCTENNAGTWSTSQQSPVANIGTAFLAN